MTLETGASRNREGRAAAPTRGLQREQAAIPVRLDLWPPPAAQPDLQHVRNPPCGPAETDLQTSGPHEMKPRQALGWLGCRAHERRCAALGRPGRPYPQPAAPGADELRSLGAHLHPHDLTVPPSRTRPMSLSRKA